MEKVFHVTIFWIWDRSSGGKLRVVTLWLHMLGVTPRAHTINGITIILFSCHCCWIQKPILDICVAFL